MQQWGKKLLMLIILKKFDGGKRAQGQLKRTCINSNPRKKNNYFKTRFHQNCLLVSAPFYLILLPVRQLWPQFQTVMLLQ